jgi:hypothetical protein
MKQKTHFAKFDSARRNLRYLFIVAVIAWLAISAFLPPIIIFSLLDAGLFYCIWNGSSFAKFLAAPWFFIRGAICFFVTLGCASAALSGSHDSGSAFFAAMLPGIATFTLFSLGAGIVLLFIPNTAEIFTSDASTLLLQARMTLSDLRVAERQAATEHHDQNQSNRPTEVSDEQVE